MWFDSKGLSKDNKISKNNLIQPSKSRNNANNSTKHFLKLFQIPLTEFQHFRYLFKELISEPVAFRKKGHLDGWNNDHFFQPERENYISCFPSIPKDMEKVFTGQIQLLLRKYTLPCLNYGIIDETTRYSP